MTLLELFIGILKLLGIGIGVCLVVVSVAVGVFLAVYAVFGKRKEIKEGADGTQMYLSQRQ